MIIVREVSWLKTVTVPSDDQPCHLELRVQIIRDFCVSIIRLLHIFWFLKCVIGRNYDCSDLRISPLWFGCRWGLWDVSSSQNIQHDPLFHPVTCSGGTRIPSLEIVSVRSCWYKKIVMYLVTAWHLKMGPIGCPETSFTTNLCCPTCQKSKDPKLFHYTELWGWFLLYFGLISFWTPSIVWCSKQNTTCWKLVLFLLSGRKFGFVESGVLMHFSDRPNWKCTFSLRIQVFCVVMLCFLVRGSWCFQGMWCLHFHGTSIATIQIVLLNHSRWPQ